MEFQLIEVATGSKPEIYASLLPNAEAVFTGRAQCHRQRGESECADLARPARPELGRVLFVERQGPGAGPIPRQGRLRAHRSPRPRRLRSPPATERKTQVVADVHAFPGHIACDPDSHSEIVVPLTLGERLLGVLDLDSPHTDRFDAADARGLEALAMAWISASDHP